VPLRRLRSRLLALVAIVSLVGLACGSNTTPDPPLVTLPPIPTAAPGLSYEEVMALAVGTDGRPGDIDAFWRRTLPLMDPSATYTPPSGLYGYDRGVPPGNVCAQAKIRNAYYCPDDDSIAWEIDFFEERQRSIGDVAPLVIMSHEWGHHIQEIWRDTTTTRQSEAQADCYAGLYVRDAMGREVIGEGDYRESVRTWYEWGTDTYDVDSWFSESEHGPGQARAWAFNHGWLTGDPTYCISFASYRPSSPVRYEGYTLRVPPGSTISLGAAAGLGYDRIVGEHASAFLQARPQLEAGDAHRLLPEISETWFPIGSTRTIALHEALHAGLDGSGATLWFEQTDTRSGETRYFHGALGLHVRPRGGGFLLEIYEPGPQPAETSGWDRVADYLHVLMSGVCPDGAVAYECTPPAGGP
jgi:hypothetical protein